MDTWIILPVVWQIWISSVSFRIGAEVLIATRDATAQMLDIEPRQQGPTYVLWEDSDELGRWVLPEGQAGLMEVLTSWPTFLEVTKAPRSSSGSDEDGPEEWSAVAAGIGVN